MILGPVPGTLFWSVPGAGFFVLSFFVFFGFGRRGFMDVAGVPALAEAAGAAVIAVADADAARLE
jgi:hypothetical protein